MNRKNSSIEKLRSILLENDQNREWVWCKIVLKNWKWKEKMTFVVTKLFIKLKLTLYEVDLVWKCFDGKVSWWCGWWCGWIAWRSCVAGLLRPGLPLARSPRWSCCRSRSWTSCRGGWLGWFGRSSQGAGETRSSLQGEYPSMTATDDVVEMVIWLCVALVWLVLPW